jgi:hypothetical protein
MNRFGIALSLVLPIAPSATRAQEQDVQIKDAPTVVIQAVSARFPDAKIHGVSKDTEEGKRIYEVTLRQGGRNIDVTTTPEGKVTLIEMEIARSDLPAPVASLLRSTYPRATYKLVEAVTSVSGSTESLAFYEVLLVDAKRQTLEVQVSPDGKVILNIEKKKKGEVD